MQYVSHSSMKIRVCRRIHTLNENNTVLKEKDDISAKLLALPEEHSTMLERYAKPVMRGQDGEVKLMNL